MVHVCEMWLKFFSYNSYHVQLKINIWTNTVSEAPFVTSWVMNMPVTIATDSHKKGNIKDGDFRNTRKPYHMIQHYLINEVWLRHGFICQIGLLTDSNIK